MFSCYILVCDGMRACMIPLVVCMVLLLLSERVAEKSCRRLQPHCEDSDAFIPKLGFVQSEQLSYSGVQLSHCNLKALRCRREC